jgi:hypothetical protein
MRLRTGVLGVTVATMFVPCPSVGPPVLASEATDQIRAAIDQMYRLVAPGSTAETREAVRKAADRMFDWAAMAESSSGRIPPRSALTTRARASRDISQDEGTALV